MLYRYCLRTQFTLFDIATLVSYINIKQLNIYKPCRNCKIHGTLIGKEMFYPHTSTAYQPKTVDDYLKFGLSNYPRSTNMGILDRTPITDIPLLLLMVPRGK